MSKHINYILLACVVVAGVLCVLSITSPLRFDSERQKREVAVKRGLKAVRTAEEQYRKQNGVYTGELRLLVSAHLLADSMQYVPYSDGEKYIVNADVKVGMSGKPTPVVECAAQYRQYLKGMDEAQTAQLTEKAETEGLYPGLRIGDVDNPNGNDGNWQ